MMKTQRILLYFLMTLCAISITAQQEIPQEIYLLEEFTTGKAYLKNHSITTTKFNYDPINRQMNYYDGDTKMVLTEISNIDSIVVADRTFIPNQQCFLEVVSAGDSPLLIDWKIRILNKGKQGAMGMPTQGTVVALDVGSIQNRGIQKVDLNVYDMVYQNTYYIYQDGKRKKFTDLKSYLKLYPPASKQAILDYVKIEKIDLKKAEDVVRLVNHKQK